MRIVIKGTKNVEEFLSVQKSIEEQAEICYKQHKNSMENWSNGEPVKVWKDIDDNICIEYENGNWWHYKISENKKVVWW